jgi:hypothetical protein
MFPCQINFFRFMADYESIALSQGVLHLLQADLDVRHVAPVGQGKPQ